MEALRKKWKDVKRTKLEYYITNITSALNVEFWPIFISKEITTINIGYMGTKVWIDKNEVLSLNLCSHSTIDDNSTLIVPFVGLKCE